MAEKPYVWHLGFKTKLVPTPEQVQYFARACGVARFAYNWALEQWHEQYRAHKADPESVPLPNECALRRKLNKIKRQEFPWMLDVTKCAPQFAIKSLGKAYDNHFRNPKHFGFPKFKRKFRNDSFTISNDQFKLEGSRICIPKLGWVRMCEPLRFKNAKVLSAVISRQADSWYVSLNCKVSDLDHLVPAENQGRIGIDLGISKLATLSNGLEFEAPKPLKNLLGKLKKKQKKFSRAKKGSNNRSKLAVEIARLHRRIGNIRKDALHKLTTFIAANYSEVVIEDLNVKGMMANHCLARAIADIGFYEFRRQLEYKIELRGGRLIVADRFFPSSKICRFCHKKNDGLQLSDREWVCPHCGAKIESRDLNAAINLCHYPESVYWWSESTADYAPPAVAHHEKSEPDVSPVSLQGDRGGQCRSQTRGKQSRGRQERSTVMDAALVGEKSSSNCDPKIGEERVGFICSDI